MNIYGRGTTFPITIENGSATISEGEKLVSQAVVQRLGTQLGELPFTPDFGSRLHEILFLPTTEVSARVGVTLIKLALEKERRITVLSVNYELSSDSSIDFTIRYQLNTGAINTLVYPFNLN